MEREGPIYVWRYALRSRSTLNAKSPRRTFEGALLRTETGFGCLHPWPELGDPPLDSLLCVLAHGETPSPLVVRALDMAASDGWARTRGLSLFAKLDIPASHATITAATEEAVEAAVRCGFRIVKLKAGRGHVSLARDLNGWARRWPSLRWRIDFNGVLTLADGMCFGECLSEQARQRVEFIEDPCPYDPGDWMRLKHATGFHLAMDQNAAPEHRAPDVFVVKPARQAPIRFRRSGRPLVVTSNMDHPLGQCFAAVSAGRLQRELPGRVVCCGLQTHGLFEKSEFSERLGPAGAEFSSPGGTGLGFDDLLERLPWRRLK